MTIQSIITLIILLHANEKWFFHVKINLMISKCCWCSKSALKSVCMLKIPATDFIRFLVFEHNFLERFSSNSNFFGQLNLDSMELKSITILLHRSRKKVPKNPRQKHPVRTTPSVFVVLQPKDNCNWPANLHRTFFIFQWPSWCPLILSNDVAKIKRHPNYITLTVINLRLS